MHDKDLLREHKQLIIPIQELLNDPTVDDISLNPNGSVYVKRADWEKYENERVTPQWAYNLIRAVSVLIAKKTNSKSPIISTELATGERIEALVEPAVKSAVITIRRAESHVIDIEAYNNKGHLEPTHDDSNIDDKTSLIATVFEMFAAGKYLESYRFMVENKFNMIFSGSTGSGKTTISQSILNMIGRDERLISIEDSAELKLDTKLGFENSIALFYPRANIDNSGYTPEELVRSCLRLRPDRILLAEIRGAEAYHYFDAIASGHGGAITSIHGATPKVSFERACKLASKAEPFMNEKFIRSTVMENLDVIFQWEKLRCKAIYFPVLDRYVKIRGRE